MVKSASLAGRAGVALFWKGVEAGGGRVMALIRTLILARLLVPEDFGLIAIGLASIDVSMGLTNFGMREALIQASDPTERHYDTAWTYEMVRAVAVAVLLSLGAPLIADIFFDEPRAAVYLRWLALVPILDHAVSIKVSALARSLRFRPQAIISLLGVAAHTVVSLALAPAFGAWALVAGVLAGGVAQIATSYVLAPHRVRFTFDRAASRALFRFGRGIFVMESVWVLGGAVLQAIISRQLGVGQLGLYFLATRLAFLPRAITQKAAGKVVFAVHSQLQEDAERAARAVRATTLGTGAILVPLYALAIALAPVLVARFVGTDWLEAVPIIRLLAVVGTFGILTDAATPLLQGRGRTDQMAALYLIRSAVLVALAWIAARPLGLPGVGLAWLAAETSVATCGVAMVNRLIPGTFRGLGNGVSIVLATGFAAAALAFGLERWIPGAAGLVVAAVAGLGLAGTIVWRTRQRLDLERVAPDLGGTRSIAERLRTLGRPET